MPAEARCQANRGINAVGFRKPTKFCDSFRFLKLFCVHFSWDGTITLCYFYINLFYISNRNATFLTFNVIISIFIFGVLMLILLLSLFYLPYKRFFQRPFAQIVIDCVLSFRKHIIIKFIFVDIF